MQNEPPPPGGLSWDEIDARLRELLELDPAAQAAWLDALEPAHPALTRRLRRLLASSAQAAALDTGAMIAGVAETTLARVASQRVGQRFGAWQLEALLGSGGMADVYLASRPIDNGTQRAAVKLVHAASAGWSTASLVREAQVLARLSDPRIARLLDFGRTEAGEPWIAMEFVDGLPIDRWCTQRRASLRERVRLMINVAMAVDHAHRNLIVHRDIKPGNVFVSTRDDGIKLLDFGIARSLPGADGQVTRTTLQAFTQAWASPEQLAGESVAVASDIYQLGQLLYLLLAGEPAFPATDAGLGAQLRRREAGAEPPGRRARLRDAGPRRALRVASDLDTITLKAMEFRPERRYLSARDFADDLRRWLDGGAITARPDRLYRAQRLLRRHWGLAAAVVLALSLTLGYIETLRDREALLEAQRLRTERILEVAVEVLNESDPYVAGSSPGAAEAALHRVRQRLRDASDGDPEFRARILALLASVHGRRGQSDVSLDLLHEAEAIASAAGLDAALIAEITQALARSLNAASRNDEALALLDRRREVLAAYQPVAAEALRARIEHQSGNPEAARQRLERVAAGLPAHGPLDADARAMLNQLAIVRGTQHDSEGSIAAAERAFAGFEPQTGKEIASWISYAMNLAVAYGDARRYRDADALHQRVAAWIRSTLGEQHPQLAIAERSRAIGLLRVARYAEASAILDGATQAAAQQRLPLHRASFLRAQALAGLYSGRGAEAMRHALAAAEIAQRELGDLPEEQARAAEDLAWALFEIGAYPQALQVARTVPAGPRTPSRRAAMVRVLAARLGVAASASIEDRAAMATSPCLSVELALLEAWITGQQAAPQATLPDTCDGQVGSRVRALGGHWTPDWASDFPLQPFDSDLVRRIRAGDFATRPLPPGLTQAWERWRTAATASEP